MQVERFDPRKDESFIDFHTDPQTSLVPSWWSSPIPLITGMSMRIMHNADDDNF